MAIYASLARLTSYYSNHGFGATLNRAALALRRALFSGRMVVFSFDLGQVTPVPVDLPDSLKVERLESLLEVSPLDLQAMTSFWNPKQADRKIKERFAKKASLWLIKSGDNLAGYGWTLQGTTIEPYYFPLGHRDVHLFDFHVFPQYRGRGMNPLLVGTILNDLTTEAGGNAFIEAAEWNEAQLSSLRKTPFRQMGRVRSLNLFGHMFVFWAEREPVELMH
jgi:hypothetical protein